MNKNRPNTLSDEHNGERVVDGNQHSEERASLGKLKARLFHLARSRADMVDVTEYAKATVRTDQGVYQTGDCEKHSSSDNEPDQPSAAKLYGAGCRFEGHVGDIKGCLDENEDASYLRDTERKD